MSVGQKGWFKLEAYQYDYSHPSLHLTLLMMTSQIWREVDYNNADCGNEYE